MARSRAWLLYVIPVLYFYIRANGSSPKKSTGNAPTAQAANAA
ncbi:hypothetical protein AHiyo8_48390 [Arthrobacter sp. Hiyo8]|nr:hypothetical protein AHiyo8_48390 [Arthrobacter sp. Hiyo8]